MAIKKKDATIDKSEDKHAIDIATELSNNGYELQIAFKNFSKAVHAYESNVFPFLADNLNVSNKWGLNKKKKEETKTRLIGLLTKLGVDEKSANDLTDSLEDKYSSIPIFNRNPDRQVEASDLGIGYKKDDSYNENLKVNFFDLIYAMRGNDSSNLEINKIIANMKKSISDQLGESVNKSGDAPEQKTKEKEGFKIPEGMNKEKHAFLLAAINGSKSCVSDMNDIKPNDLITMANTNDLAKAMDNFKSTMTLSYESVKEWGKQNLSTANCQKPTKNPSPERK